MAGNKSNTNSKKRYAQISLKKRQILVNSVMELGQPLTKTAKKLKIKLSTAKLILKKFKKSGVLMNKKLRNAKKESETSSTHQSINLVIPTFEIKQHRTQTENISSGVNEPFINLSPGEIKVEQTPVADNICWINPFFYNSMVFPFQPQCFFF